MEKKPVETADLVGFVGHSNRQPGQKPSDDPSNFYEIVATFRKAGEPGTPREVIVRLSAKQVDMFSDSLPTRERWRLEATANPDIAGHADRIMSALSVAYALDPLKDEQPHTATLVMREVMRRVVAVV